MSVGPLLARARSLHQQLMTDACTITRSTRSTFNAATGDYTTSSSSIYSGACRVKGPTAGQAAVDEATAGDAEQTRTRQTLVVPHGQASTADTGDTVTITSGPLTGRVFTVVGVVDATTMTARSLLIEAVQ